mgnify:CR=1 FL=1
MIKRVLVSLIMVLCLSGVCFAVGMDKTSIGMTTYTLECDPCKCPVNGMADCYEFMAQLERARQDQYKNAIELLERAKKFRVLLMIILEDK